MKLKKLLQKNPGASVAIFGVALFGAGIVIDLITVLRAFNHADTCANTDTDCSLNNYHTVISAGTWLVYSSIAVISLGATMLTMAEIKKRKLTKSK